MYRTIIHKFAQSVYNSIYNDNPYDDLDILEELSITTGTKIPKPLYQLDKKSVNFSNVVSADNMFDEVLKFIKK